MKTKQIPNKVWIELDRPRDDDHANQIAKLINNVLRKIEPNIERQFFWNSEDCIWCIGNDFGYIALADNGEWFNLDYLGKD